MLGAFILPFFALGLVLGLVGIAIFLYLLSRRMISSYLVSKYSIEASVPIITMDEIYITPSVLNYFGIVLFALFFIFNIFVLAMMKDNLDGKKSFFNLMFYMTVYLLVYPIVLVAAGWHFIKGKSVWR